MSCAIGLKHGKHIWLAAEGLASSSDGIIRSHSCEKIFKNGDYHIAYVGSVRTGQILMKDHFTPPKFVFDLPNTIRDQCEELGCFVAGEDGMQVMASNFLVVHKGKLYEILVDFQMMEVKSGYSAIGSGSSFAYGSLFSTEGLPPEERVRTALGAACHFHGACGGEYQIIKI